MANRRTERVRTRRDADGNIVCSCGCGRRPAPPRRTWFSQECVDAWKLRNDPKEIRRLVYARDRGVCADCGVNSSKAFKAASLRNNEISRELGPKYGGAFYSHREYLREMKLRRLQEGIDGWTFGRSTGWDAHHTVPVCEGGAQCPIELIVTLCHRCHKKENAALAARRVRRGGKELTKA